MAEMFDSATDLSGSITADGTWRDLDVSAYVPASASAALLVVTQNDAGFAFMGFRKNGSTDTHSITGEWEDKPCKNYLIVGLDSNQILEYYVESGFSPLVQLWGYLQRGEYIALTNGTGYAVDTTWGTTDHDLTSDKTSAGDVMEAAVFEVGDANKAKRGCRPTGSSNTKEVRSMRYGQMLTPVDSNEQCNLYSDTAAITSYLIGYFKASSNATYQADTTSSTYDNAVASTWEDSFTGLNAGDVILGQMAVTAGSSSNTSTATRASSGVAAVTQTLGNIEIGLLWFSKAHTDGTMETIAGNTGRGTWARIVDAGPWNPAGYSFIGMPV